MTIRSLDQWLDYIGGVHPRSIDLGLERVRVVAERLDVLPPAPTNVVVAGTNGKGSTTLYCEALLRASGLRVGTTISPHLHRFNERIRIDGETASDTAITRSFEAVEAARQDATLTYFEYAILAALTVFKSENVDACVLEVGLGGRLDAVNLVDADVAVITSIGLDHQEYLGDDLESIAFEKAGVMRAARPCVFGESSVPQAIVRRAAALGSPLYVADRDFGVEVDAQGWRFRGTHNGTSLATDRFPPARIAARNAANALQAICLLGFGDRLEDKCAQACEVHLDGRFERRRVGDREWIFDVAHNPHGARFLATQLEAAGCPGKIVAVMGCLKEKDAAGIVAALEAVVDEWVFVTTEGSRGQPAQATARAVGEDAQGPAVDSLPRALELASTLAGTDGRIVVCGSFDVVGRALDLVACVR